MRHDRRCWTNAQSAYIKDAFEDNDKDLLVQIFRLQHFENGDHGQLRHEGLDGHGVGMEERDDVGANVLNSFELLLRIQLRDLTCEVSRLLALLLKFGI